QLALHSEQRDQRSEHPGDPAAAATASERKPLGEPKVPMAISEYAVRPVPQVVAHEVTAPRQTKRWVDWILTTDHKRIGIMYLVTTFVFFGLGGIEALLMRLQLGVPNNTLITNEHYNQLLTLHGT